MHLRDSLVTCMFLSFLQIKIMGSYGAKAQSDLPVIVNLAASGKLDLTSSVTQKYSLKDAGYAYNLLHDGKISGRAIIDMEL